jgi:cell division protein FtsZ
VQQACSIIQNAAHDEANIIFGAVLDEKMKDGVKITVIATGFREIPGARPRPIETRTSFAAVHDEAMEFPEAFDSSGPMPDSPKHIMSEPAMDEPADRGYEAEPAPMPSAQDRGTDVISLEAVRSALVSNFEQNDLDVPAFLRKRNDLM